MSRRLSPAAQSARAVARVVPDALGESNVTRSELMLRAGADLAEQALLTRLVINKLRDALSARMTQRLIVNAGLHQSQVREFVDEDVPMQLRAAAELVDLLGLKPSRSAGITATGPMTINVTFTERPNMVKAKVIQGIIQHPPQ
jgi:hypothetical protein